MSTASPQWQPGASSDLHRPLGELKACLLTTFEPPEADFLVEDVLPAWLAMSRESTDTGSENAVFLVDLQARLRRLRGRLSVFSSSRPTSGSGHWLWRDMHLHTVGAQERVTQHAKVWLFHRAPGAGGNAETLEVVVSSANLTRAGFTSQVQAGWRLVVPLGKPTRKNTASWGPLPGFLEALAKHSGPLAKPEVGEWLKSVLPRATCPADVTFIASVPGIHPASTLRRKDSAWGTAGVRCIRQPGPLRVDVVAPTVGSFDQKQLCNWAKRVGAGVERLRLAWAEADRADVNDRWQMPKKTAAALREAGVEVIRFPDPSDTRKTIKHFHPEWPQTAERWMHGKLYWFRQRSSTRLLVTSANFSDSAWGRPVAGGLRIENFEFGVVFDCAWNPTRRLPTLKGALYTQAPTESIVEPVIAWAQASWDGKGITLRLRLGRTSREPAQRVVLRYEGVEDRMVKFRWSRTGGACFEGTIAWTAPKGHPRSLDVSVAGTSDEAVGVPILDVRPVKAGEPSTFSGVSDDQARELETRLLEERYGGQAVDPPKPPRSKPVDKPGPSNDGVANYGVPVIVGAREKFEIVSCWAKHVEAGSGYDHERVLTDGERLAELWRAGHDLATRVARDEIVARLKVLR